MRNIPNWNPKIEADQLQTEQLLIFADQLFRKRKLEMLGLQ